MKFIYTTDLHGQKNKFNDILSYAIDNKIKIVHLGGDLLPKPRKISVADALYLSISHDLKQLERLNKFYNPLEVQRTFVSGFLKGFYKEALKANIRILSFFGNDDFYSLKKNFRKYGSLLDEQPIEIEDYLFKAYPFVCDHPFGLKTACKLDYRGWERPFSKLAVDEQKEIINLDEYFNKKATIEEDLKKEVVLNNNLIMACHMPPRAVNLDVCGRRLMSGKFDKIRIVGSKSVYDWIVKEKPLIVLCGHIHENYEITNIWKTNIGKTLVVQPGQSLKTRFVLFEIRKEIESTLIEI